MQRRQLWWETTQVPDSIRMESEQDKAIRLFKEQLTELQTVRGFSHEHPQFKAWYDTTKNYMRMYLPENSPFRSRLRNLRFSEPPVMSSDFPGVRQHVPQHSPYFEKDCKTADATIRATIKHLEEFGVLASYPQDPAPASKAGRAAKSRSHGGVHQTFHGPVTIQTQAIATDNAIQRVGYVGDMGGDFSAMLKDVAALFQQSEELKGKEIKAGLAAIEGLATEAEKNPRRRNWKSMIENGERLLWITDKAGDLAQRLAPYTPTIAALVAKAKHALGLNA